MLDYTPKSDTAGHWLARNKPILLIIYMLKLLLPSPRDRNDGNPLFGMASTLFIFYDHFPARPDPSVKFQM